MLNLSPARIQDTRRPLSALVLAALLVVVPGCEAEPAPEDPGPTWDAALLHIDPAESTVAPGATIQLTARYDGDGTPGFHWILNTGSGTISGQRHERFKVTAPNTDGLDIGVTLSIDGAGGVTRKAVVRVRKPGPAASMAWLHGRPRPPIPAGALSPDGTRVALAGHDGSVRLFSTITGLSAGPPFFLPAQSATAVAFHPNSQALVALGSQNSAWSWPVDAPSQALKLPISGKWLAFSPDGQRLAVSTQDRVQVVVAATGDLLVEHEGYGGPTAWSPEGDRLAAASGAVLRTDVDIALWGKPSSNKVNPRVYWSPAGDRILFGATHSGQAELVDADTGAILSRIGDKHPTFGLVDAAWSPDGQRIVWLGGGLGVSGWQGRIQFIDPDGVIDVTNIHDFDGFSIDGVDWQPDGETLVLRTQHDAMTLRASDGEVLSSLIGHWDEPRAVAWSPDGEQWLSASRAEMPVFLHDPADGDVAGAYDGHTEAVGGDQPVTWAAWRPGGQEVATVDVNAVRIWSPATGKTLRVLSKPPTPLGQACAWRPDGKQIACFGGGTARGGGPGLHVFDSDAAVWLEVRSASPGGDIAWRPDGQLIVHSGKAFDIANDHAVAFAVTGNRPAFSPDGKSLAVLQPDKRTVRLYDGAAGTEIAKLVMDFATDAIAWSPDGQRLAVTGGASRTDVVTVPDLKVLASLLPPGQLGDARTLAWQPGAGEQLVVGTEHGILSWRVADLEVP